MSAIGSVIVMACGLFPTVVSHCPSSRETCGDRGLPAALRHARKLTAVRHVAQAHAAEAELAVDGPGTSTPLAAGVVPDLELRLAGRLDDQCRLCHRSELLEGEAELLEERTPLLVVGRG